MIYESIKLTLTILFAFLVVSHGYSQKYGELIFEGEVNQITYKVYSQRNSFEKFWKQAENSHEEIQLSLWKDIIYNTSKDYWNTEFSESAYENMDKEIAQMVKKHIDVFKSNNSLKKTKTFESALGVILNKTFSYYGDKIDTISVILVPIGNQGGTVRAISNRKSIMPIGVNVLTDIKTLQTIIPHEYTHRYNQLKGGFSSEIDIWINQAKMFWSLWTEGLATYGTGIVTNNFSIDNLMLAQEYRNSKYTTNIDPKLDSWLATEFLKQYNDKLVNLENDIPRAQWFATNSTPLRSDLPPSIGYYLGFKMVTVAIEQFGYTFDELLSLKPKNLKRIGLKALIKIKKKRI